MAKRRSRGASRRIPKGVRGDKSPNRHEKGRDARKPVVRLAQVRTTRRNPVLQRLGRRQYRKPTAGIVERTVGRNKPRAQKCQRGTNVLHMSPPSSGTHTIAERPSYPCEAEGQSLRHHGIRRVRCSTTRQKPSDHSEHPWRRRIVMLSLGGDANHPPKHSPETTRNLDA